MSKHISLANLRSLWLTQCVARRNPGHRCNRSDSWITFHSIRVTKKITASRPELAMDSLRPRFKPIRPDDWNDWNSWNQITLESEGAAAFARVGASYKGAGFGMNHDGVGAAEGFRSAGDNLMASALQFFNCRFGQCPSPNQP
jgi:hypothetical protein